MTAAESQCNNWLPWALVLVIAVGTFVPHGTRAGELSGLLRESGTDVVGYQHCAVGDAIVAIAAIDSMTIMTWRDGVGAQTPHLRLHLDIKRVLYGSLSSDTIVVSDNVAVCSGGELSLITTTVGPFWPYAGDLVLFCAFRLQHGGVNVWHVCQMSVIEGYGKPGARLYRTVRMSGERRQQLQGNIDCSEGEDRGLNNRIPRTLTDIGALEEFLRAVSATW